MVWALVAGALLLLDLRRELAFRARLARAERIRDPQSLALLEECRRRAGVRRSVELVHCDLVTSPAAFGLVRARILLPGAVRRCFPPAELRHVFLHELAHLRRGDVALNALLVVAQRLYWFHPLVRVAVARLRAAQESARDWEAVSLGSDAGPVSYARTLLRLLEQRAGGGRQTARVPSVGFLQDGKAVQRRILMITRYRSASPSSAFLGLGLVALLGWTTFTRAAGPEPEGDGPAAAAADQERRGGAAQLERIQVERQRPGEPWRSDLMRRLGEQRLSFALERARLVELFELLREHTGLNILAEPDLEVDEDRELSFVVNDLTVEQVLNLLQHYIDDLEWCLVRESVYVGLPGQVPQPMDLRFYDIEKLVDPDEDGDPDPDYVMELTRELTTSSHYEWEIERVSLDYWRGLMVVMQTDPMHRRVQEVLDRMLNRGESPQVPEPVWKRELRERLGQVVTIDFSGEDMGSADIAVELGKLAGVSVVYPEWLNEVDPLPLKLTEVTVATALEWLAETSEAVVYLDHGAVVFDEFEPLEVEFYEVGDLVHSAEDAGDWEDADGLSDMIRDHIDPDSWDERPECSIHFWRDLMIVAQSRGVLEQITDLLAAARRASKR